METNETNETNNVNSEVTTATIVESKQETAKVIEFKATKSFDNEDLFVTEKSTFDVICRYYRDEKGELIVEGVTDEFDKSKDCQEITVTVKYPSQSDYQAMLTSPSFKNLSELKAVDIVLLELNRLSLLIRGWSLKQDMSRILEMDPRLIKGILWSVNNKIGMLGIW